MKQMITKISNWLKDHNWQRRALELVIFILVFTGVRFYQQRDVYDGQVLSFEGILLDQTRFNLQQFQGKPFLIHFWASWCPVCRLEENSINALAKDYPVITVASWSDDVASYMAEKKLSFPVIEDPDGDLASQYGIKGVPASFFVDAEGQIRFVEIGYTSETGFRLRLWWLQ